MWNGGVILIKEGQLLTGRKALSADTDIPEATIERILKYLESEHQIEQQKYTKFRVITILNWKEYQISDTKMNNKRTTDGQQVDTNKNDNNEKNAISMVSTEVLPTPSKVAKDFFDQGSSYENIRMLLVAKIDPDLVDRELSKFVSYWTEPNKSGTKVRWQLQPTFDVKRRLRTWLDRVGQRNTTFSKGKGLIV